MPVKQKIKVVTDPEDFFKCTKCKSKNWIKNNFCWFCGQEFKIRKIAENIYRGRIKDKAKRLKSTFMIEIILKPLATAFIVGFSRYISLFKPDTIAYRNYTINKILKNICKKNKYKGLAKSRLLATGKIMSFVLSMDTAYSRIFEDFIKEYYETHNH